MAGGEKQVGTRAVGKGSGSDGLLGQLACCGGRRRKGAGAPVKETQMSPVNGAAAAGNGGAVPSGAPPRRPALPKLAMPAAFRRTTSDSSTTPRDTARTNRTTPRTPSSPGVLYVDHP
jgi:hypothetical protein